MLVSEATGEVAPALKRGSDLPVVTWDVGKRGRGLLVHPRIPSLRIQVIANQMSMKVAAIRKADAYVFRLLTLPLRTGLS